MKDINGYDLLPGRMVVIASKDQASANVPILRKATILEVKEPIKNEYGGYTNGYIKLYYPDTHRKSTIDGYLYMTDKRFCIID